MTLQASGPISFSQIGNEFGIPPGKNIGAYRINQSIGDLTLPLDNGIPTFGTIRFSNFYNKRLNIVVYCKGSRVIARNRYNENNNVYVIGGYRNRPVSSSGTKIWIHTNENIGSDIPANFAPNINYCSLITGGWDSDTDLRLDIGTNAIVSGAGGDGGRGGNCDYLSCETGQPGRFGTSAIGVNHQPIVITNRGRIQGGAGGGGGGGVAFTHNHRSGGRSVHSKAPGGGGGGGFGIPGGNGGAAGLVLGNQNRSVTIRNSQSGSSGTILVNGSGGLGQYQSGDGADSEGGRGGDATNNGAPGNIITAFDDRCSSGGGASGSSGFGIIITNDGTGVSISGNGRIGGDVYNTPIS